MSEIFDSFLRGFGAFLSGILIFLFFDLIWAFPIMWSWNYVMPYLFGLPELNWLRAWCLLFVLTSLWKISIVSYKK